MLVFRIIFAAFVLLLGLPAQASSLKGFTCESSVKKSEGEKLLTRVEERYREVKGVTSSFVQYSYFAGLSRGELSKGTVRFMKPGMMDWQYVEPSKQRFIADGKVLHFFQPEDNQVTLGDFTNSFQSDLPVSFLLGVGKVREQFDLESSCRSDKGVLLKLAPKSATDFEDVTLLVSDKVFMPLGAQIIDVGGNETTISLVDLKEAANLKKESFSFTIPKGVDIIDRRKRIQSEPRPIVTRDVVPTSAPKGKGSSE